MNDVITVDVNFRREIEYNMVNNRMCAVCNAHVSNKNETSQIVFHFLARQLVDFDVIDKSNI